MHSKTVFFVAGLPRSGSTLLMNILGQNPRFHVTETSGLIDILLYVRNSWNKNSAFLAIDRERSTNTQLSVMRGAIEGYFAGTERPVCFDKNRLWLEYLEMAAAIQGGADKVRVLVTVRDMRDVLASFEKRYRDTVALSSALNETMEPLRFKTALQRVEYFLDPAQAVGRAYNAIRDAATRGWLERMHFIEYDALTGAPGATMDAIYEFLGEPPYRHDFANVEQLTSEDDLFHGFKDLHTIRRKVEPQSPSWPLVFDRTVVATPQWRDIEKVSRFWRGYMAPETETSSDQDRMRNSGK